MFGQFYKIMRRESGIQLTLFTDVFPLITIKIV